MNFPTVRHRRLRGNSMIRNLVREHHVSIDDLVQPLFVIYGTGKKIEIPSMPGVYQFSLDLLDSELHEIVECGIQAIILFGIPEFKDCLASSATDAQGIVQQATRKIKNLYPQLLVITDTCLCQYTHTGHCGITQHPPNSDIVTIANDASLALLAEVAVSQASAGADMIAPSNMMDGTVTAIRSRLDQAGFTDTPIMAYAVKYASAFYGPFRDAAHSSPQFGDRKTYQMDPANAREAIREAYSDCLEGADLIMVKPALCYLDIIRQLRERVHVPIVAYNVSAEYAMVKSAAQQSWINEQAVVLEMMVSFKRAGADLIITYFAKDIAKWLRPISRRPINEF